jgi:hypothetical protein
MPYGYLGTTPNQQLNNSGVFSVEEALALKNVGELGGSLELIEEQTVSGTPTTINFTTLKENIYDVHFMTYSNIQGNSTTAQDLQARVSNDGGSSFEGGTNYDYANQDGRSNGTFSEIRDTGSDIFMLAPDLDNETNASINGYIYFYDLGDSTKYSFVTDMNFLYQSAVNGRFRWGGSVYKVAETINAIQLMTSGGGGFSAGNVKLYGVKQI